MYDPWFATVVTKPHYRFFTRCSECGETEKVRVVKYDAVTKHYEYSCQNCDSE